MPDQPDTVMIPARRFAVSTDLGMVRQGDYVLVVGNVVVALDSSRAPDVPPPPAPASAPVPDGAARIRKKTKRAVLNRLSAQHVYGIVQEHQPITALVISDKLGFERNDTQSRAKVTRLLKNLVLSGEVQRHEDKRLRQFRYELPQPNVLTSA